MQYLNLICIVVLFFGRKIQIQLKSFLWCKRNPYGLHISTCPMYMPHLFEECRNLKLLIKLLWRIVLFSINISTKFYRQSLKIGSRYQLILMHTTVVGPIQGLIGLLKSKLYGRNSVNSSAIYTWDYLLQLNDFLLSSSKLKCNIKEFFVNEYN